MAVIPEAARTALAPLTLWVVPVADLGGVARHVLDVARVGLPGLRLAVLCPEGPLAERLREQGAAVFTGAVGPDAGLAASVRMLRTAVRTLRPAAVHTHLAYADLAAFTALGPGRARQRAGAPALLSTEHGIAPDDGLYNRAAAARVKNAAHRARLRGTDLVIAVAQSTADVLRRKWGTGAPLTVVRNGVDVPAVRAAAAGQRRTPGEGLRILSLSRLAPEKGLDRLIAALPVLLEQDPGTRLTLAGVGPLEGQLRAQAEALGVADAVDLPGFVEPWETMAEHDVLVQLSAWENLSYTLLDAAAAGLPAVATDVGGNGEILPPERLVHETTPAAIADAVVRAAAEGPGEVRVADVETMARATAEATLEVLGRRVGKTLG
ncbi:MULTISPECIES: glycosyltransferase [Micrococcus]|uniref:glycosyltransferase n=2 Tax=Micrococcus luteus TaxID=1270 RepID=UPI00289F833F|nr:glycosyltransferase [Micrococcus luteus]